jgi:TonB family protein
VSVSKQPPGSNKAKRQPPRRITFWLALAALIHAELALVAGLAFYAFAPRDADLAKAKGGPGESIEIGMVDEEAARQILADLERQEEQNKAEQVKKEVESVKSPGQVVDIPVPREERRPDDARFAAEHDSTVEKEQKKYGKFEEKSRQGDATGQAAESRPETPATPPSDSRLAMRTPRETNAPKAAPSPKGREQAGEKAGSQYGAPTPGPEQADGSLPQAGATLQPKLGGGGLPGGMPALTPSHQQLARAIGGGSQDALKDIDEGEETALNAKKWRFASFFNRVKKQVADHWHPEEAYRRGDPTGSIYGQKNRLTILRVQLKPDGTLANVALEQPSGVEFLDDEAIEAFKQAQPFPNPPRQLVENGGVINFRFGFLFELSGTPRMKLFRYNNM